MKVSDHFTLEYLQGVPYLLPYGQAVADLRRGLQLNETGVFLWKTLTEVPDFDALLEKTAAYYEADAAERAMLTEDLRQFVDTLRSYGILTADDALSSPDAARSAANSSARESSRSVLHAEAATLTPAACMTDAPVRVIAAADAALPCRVLQIGGLCIHFYGETADFFSEFSAFSLQSTADAKTAPDLTIIIRYEALPKPVSGRPLLSSADLAVYAQASAYTLLFPSFTTIDGAILSADGGAVTFYCPDAADERSFPIADSARRTHGDTVASTASRAEELFHAIRFVYLYLAQRRGMFALHSVSILYKEKLWLFSGHSGMGKSTHAALWERLYHTPVINGDLNLLSLSEEGAVVQGIPWCGTSGIFDVHTYPLGGIFLLKRGETDAVSPLSMDKQQLLTMQRFISPCWTKAQLDTNLDFAGKLAARVPIMRLACTKNERAATTCKNWIDAFL